MLVEQRPMKSSSSACLFVRPTLIFLKIRSLVFPDIVHDKSSPKNLVTEIVRFLRKTLVTRVWA